MNKNQRVIRYAYKRGYRVNADGSVAGIRKSKIKLRTDTDGYLRFSVRHPEIGQFPIRVHALQAYQKFGEKVFCDDIQVRHLNGNRKDNSLDNIEIGTASDNAMDISKSIRRSRAKKAGRSKSSMTTSDVEKIRELRETLGYTYQQIMKIYPMAKSTLSYICNYTTWVD